MIFHDPEIILKRFILPGDTVVDIGCGPGYFTIPMAYMVGEKGKVIAIDLQEKMIERLNKKIDRYFLVRKRIEPLVCQENDLNVNEQANFILTFWMVHEVTDPGKLFSQIKDILKPDSYYLLSEPKFHVRRKQFDSIVAKAKAAGLKPVEEAEIAFSRSMVFTV